MYCQTTPNNHGEPQARRSTSLSVSGAAVVLVALAVSACSPSLAPLYTDFETNAPVVSNDSILVRVERAIATAGWAQTESAADNVVATEERVLRRWGLYDVRVSIELAPISDHYVRVFINPYRVYFTGARSKMPFLKRSIRRAVVPDLERALKEQSIEPIGSAIERDRLAEKQ